MTANSENPRVEGVEASAPLEVAAIGARILCLPKYDPLGASSRLRTYQYVDWLRDHGFSVDIHPLFDKNYLSRKYAGRAPWREALHAYSGRIKQLLARREYDVVWLEKELLPWVPTFIERIFTPSRPKLVVDYDDAIFHNYDLHRSTLVRAVLGDKIDDVMRRADMVLAGNAYLAGRAASAGCARVENLPTVVDLDRYPFTVRQHAADEEVRPVVIGWIGSPATAHYLSLLAGVAERLQARYSVRFVAIGARPDQVDGSPFEALPWTEASEVQLLRSIDIGVMPLVDGPWERGKCGYKLIQYMACNRPVVASPVGVNCEIVDEGINGYLADGKEAWERALSTLIESPELRQSMGDQARARVEQMYSLQTQAPRLCDFFSSMIGRGDG